MRLIPDVQDNDGHIKRLGISFALLFKWIVFGMITGVIVGLVGTVFCYMLSFATSFRQGHMWMIFLLPVAGVLIVGMYHFFKDYHDTGTNLIIKELTEGQEVPLFKAPLIIISTFLTHLCGGSAGREGAALQFGGSLGYNIGKLFRMSEGDKKITTMSGMAAAFSALFGTPMAASFFAMELSNVGSMHYAALVPAVIAAMISKNIALYFGVVPDAFTVKIVPDLSLINASETAILAISGALVSVLFCISIKEGRKILDHFFKEPYVKVVAGGLIIIVLSLIFRSGYYNGAGMNVIEMAFNGEAPYWAFAVKLLFTSITLGAGYKGGEIVPTFYVGATYGCLFATLTGFPMQLGVAMGMISLFCGVTNCPVSSLLLAFEMFGFDGMPYYLLAVALSYAISGYNSLYGSQEIRYSKLKFR